MATKKDGPQANTHFQHVQEMAGKAQQGVDATGANSYATVVTASGEKRNILVTVETNAATISLDGGTTDHIDVPADKGVVLNNILIADTTVIQAKNRDAGSNYTNLAITIW